MMQFRVHVQFLHIHTHISFLHNHTAISAYKYITFIHIHILCSSCDASKDYKKFIGAEFLSYDALSIANHYLLIK